MRRKILALILVLAAGGIAEARTWKPIGRRAILGDFQDIQGNNVLIRTNTGGIETVPYMKLTSKDRAVVKSNLISMGRQSDAAKLTQLESGDGEMPEKDEEGSPDDGDKDGDKDGAASRVWTDNKGNKLQAELVSVSGLQVVLRTSAGELQTFPISGFSAEDQIVILQSGKQNAGAAASGTGGQPGMAPGAQPGMPPGNGISGFPGGIPGFPNAGFPNAGLPGSQPGMRPGFPSPEVGPAFGPGMQNPAMNPPGMNPGGFSGIPGAPGMSMGAEAPPITPSEFGPGSMSSQLPGFSGSFPQAEPPQMPEPAQPDFSMPNFPSAADQHPMANPGPQWVNVYKCDSCGAEFSEGEGVKSGDRCPKCSGGFSLGGRGVVRGLVTLAALAAGGIGWVIKKASGKA